MLKYLVKIEIINNFINKMRKPLYKNIRSNKTIAKLGQRYDYVRHGENSLQRIKDSLSYNFVENNIDWYKLERPKLFCSICGRKCGNPELMNDLHSYKTKSKKKSKGINKRRRYTQEFLS